MTDPRPLSTRPGCPIDEPIYAVLEGVADGDREFLREVLQEFLGAAEVMVGAMVDGAESGRAEPMTRAAHTLKSSSALVGALRLSDLCEQLQSRGREDRLDGCRGLARATRSELEIVRCELTLRIEKLQD